MQLKYQPGRNIMEPHPHDVLSGRGAGVLKWAGNKRWRELIKEKQAEYISLKKHEKIYLTQSIVFAVRSLSPPGRFLAKDARGRWYEIGENKANEKTAQALREGAPKLRKRLSESSKDSQKSPKMNQSPPVPNQTTLPKVNLPSFFNPQEQCQAKLPQSISEKLPSFCTQPINSFPQRNQEYDDFFNARLESNQTLPMLNTEPWSTQTAISADQGNGRIDLGGDLDSEPLHLFNDDFCNVFDELDAKQLAACLESSSEDSFPRDKKPSVSAKLDVYASLQEHQQQVKPSPALQKLLQKQRDLFASFVANDAGDDDETINGLW